MKYFDKFVFLQHSVTKTLKNNDEFICTTETRVELDNVFGAAERQRRQILSREREAVGGGDVNFHEKLLLNMNTQLMP